MKQLSVFTLPPTTTQHTYTLDTNDDNEFVSLRLTPGFIESHITSNNLFALDIP